MIAIKYDDEFYDYIDNVVSILLYELYPNFNFIGLKTLYIFYI